jgi:hypothetical protein
MSTVASMLQESIGSGMTAEKLEWLMFERPYPGESGKLTSEPCFSEWLRRQQRLETSLDSS